MRTFITAQDVPKSGELRIPRGAVVTALAQEIAATRGVCIIQTEEAKSPTVTSGCVIAMGADHGGFAMKQALLPVIGELGFTVRDIGVHDEKPVDYPDIAVAVADLVASGAAQAGVIVDGAGIGSAMAANKVPGIRAALCYDVLSARNSREHNHANILTLGGRLLSIAQAELVLRTWLATPFGGGRHQARVGKIMAIEKRSVETALRKAR